MKGLQERYLYARAQMMRFAYTDERLYRFWRAVMHTLFEREREEGK